MRVITADLPVLTAEDILRNPEKHDPWISPRHGRLNPAKHRSTKYARVAWTSLGMTYESCTKGFGISQNTQSVFQSKRRLEYGES
jgi:hypothetical protein